MYVIALYMNSWNSLTFFERDAWRNCYRTWFRLEVLPVPGCPQRYIRPEVPLRRLLERNLPMIRCSVSLVNTVCCPFCVKRRLVFDSASSRSA